MNVMCILGVSIDFIPDECYVYLIPDECYVYLSVMCILVFNSYLSFCPLQMCFCMNRKKLCQNLWQNIPQELSYQK